MSGSHLDPCPEDLQSFQDPGSSVLSQGSHPSLGEEVEHKEQDLSNDEGLLPELSAFTGLFPLAIFKSLLFKASNTACLGSSLAGDEPQTSRERSNALFSEPNRAVDVVPVPPLFLTAYGLRNVVLTSLQWAYQLLGRFALPLLRHFLTWSLWLHQLGDSGGCQAAARFE